MLWEQLRDPPSITHRAGAGAGCHKQPGYFPSLQLGRKRGVPVMLILAAPSARPMGAKIVQIAIHGFIDS